MLKGAIQSWHDLKSSRRASIESEEDERMNDVTGSADLEAQGDQAEGGRDVGRVA